MSLPKVSVVIPSFRDPRIVETIESVKAQHYDADRIEIVVMDGGSADALLTDIRRALPPGSHLVSEPDDGIYDAINRGLERATGDAILTIGSDDRLVDADLFAKVAKEFLGGANVVFCGTAYTDKNWKEIRRWPAYEFKYLNFIIGRQFSHFALFCGKNIYEKTEYFNCKNKVNADYEFFHKMLKNKKRWNVVARCLPGYGVQMRMGGASSRDILGIISNNIKILKYILRNDVYLLAGFFLKPVHKAIEVLRVRLRR